MMKARDRFSRSDRNFRVTLVRHGCHCKICRCGYEIICHGALIYHSWWELFALDLQRTSLFQQWRMKAMHLEVQLILSDNLVAFWSVKMRSAFNWRRWLKPHSLFEFIQWGLFRCFAFGKVFFFHCMSLDLNVCFLCFYKLAEVVVVRISDEGFSPRNLTLYEGQVSKIGVKLR